MANIKSAQKRIRQTEFRTAVNKTRRTRIRSFIRKVEAAIEGGKKKDAAEALKTLQPEFMSGVTKGIFHKNTASRRISRLSKKVKALG